MYTASNYILRTPIRAIQFLAGAMFSQAPQIIELLDDDADAIFYHGSHVNIEFDDFTMVTANNTDFIVRVGDDIEVFSEEDFHAMFVQIV